MLQDKIFWSSISFKKVGIWDKRIFILQDAILIQVSTTKTWPFIKSLTKNYMKITFFSQGSMLERLIYILTLFFNLLLVFRKILKRKTFNQEMPMKIRHFKNNYFRSINIIFNWLPKTSFEKIEVVPWILTASQ